MQPMPGPPRLLNPADYAPSWTFKTTVTSLPAQTGPFLACAADPKRFAVKISFTQSTTFYWGFSSDISNQKGIHISSATGQIGIFLDYPTDGGFVQLPIYVYSSFGFNDFMTVYEMLWIPKGG